MSAWLYYTARSKGFAQLVPLLGWILFHPYSTSWFCIAKFEFLLIWLRDGSIFRSKFINFHRSILSFLIFLGLISFGGFL